MIKFIHEDNFPGWSETFIQKTIDEEDTTSTEIMAEFFSFMEKTGYAAEPMEKTIRKIAEYSKDPAWDLFDWAGSVGVY